MPPTGPRGERVKLRATVRMGSTRGKALPNLGIVLAKWQPSAQTVLVQQQQQQQQRQQQEQDHQATILKSSLAIAA